MIRTTWSATLILATTLASAAFGKVRYSCASRTGCRRSIRCMRRRSRGPSRSRRPRTARSRSRSSRRSSSARRSTTTTWRATRSPTSRMSIRATSPAASRSSRRSSCRSSSPTRKEGSAALDAWYRRYAAQEMKDVRYCLAFAHDPGTFHFTTQEGGAAGRHGRPEGAPAERGDRELDAHARRRQRAGRGAGNPRRAGKGRGRRGRLALGLDGAVRHRQASRNTTSTRRSMCPSRSGC